MQKKLAMAVALGSLMFVFTSGIHRSERSFAEGATSNLLEDAVTKLEAPQASHTATTLEVPYDEPNLNLSAGVADPEPPHEDEQVGKHAKPTCSIEDIGWQPWHPNADPPKSMATIPGDTDETRLVLLLKNHIRRGEPVVLQHALAPKTSRCMTTSILNLLNESKTTNMTNETMSNDTVDDPFMTLLAVSNEDAWLRDIVQPSCNLTWPYQSKIEYEPMRIYSWIEDYMPHQDPECKLFFALQLEGVKEWWVGDPKYINLAQSDEPRPFFRAEVQVGDLIIFPAWLEHGTRRPRRGPNLSLNGRAHLHFDEDELSLLQKESIPSWMLEEIVAGEFHHGCRNVYQELASSYDL